MSKLTFKLNPSLKSQSNERGVFVAGLLKRGVQNTMEQSLITHRVHLMSFSPVWLSDGIQLV